MNDLNTCGECAQHLEGLAKDDQDPRLQLTVLTGAGRGGAGLRVEEAAAAAQSPGAAGGVQDGGARAHWAD